MSLYARFQLAVIALTLVVVVANAIAVRFVGGSARSRRAEQQRIESDFDVLASVSACLDGDAALASFSSRLPSDWDERAVWFRAHPVPATARCADFGWMRSHPDLEPLHSAIEAYFRARAEQIAALGHLREVSDDKAASSESFRAADAAMAGADAAFSGAEQAVRDARDRRADLVDGRLAALLEREGQREEDVAMIRVTDAAQLLGAALHPANPYAPLDRKALQAGTEKLERELAALPTVPRFTALRASAMRMVQTLHLLIDATPERQLDALDAATDARRAFDRVAVTCPVRL